MMRIKPLISEESGQGLVEYSLIASLIILTAVAGVIVFGGSVYNLYETIKKHMTEAM